MHILDDLKYRELIYQTTDNDLYKRLAEGPITLYAGFDPTADSLHIGHLLPLLVLRRFQLAGHRPIALIGGGTGRIGDPSGKSSERSLNPEQQIDEWCGCFEKQISRYLDTSPGQASALIINNHDWLGDLKFIPFLRDIGKHFSIPMMLAKDSVKARLATGISFTEFSYMLLQSYDFLQLLNTHNCELQIGGSDQWGNITSGMDLVRRIKGSETWGMTVPLVTRADGGKFGKTESGAVWIDPHKTSPYQFYQFWINIDDDSSIKFLKYYTFLSHQQIDQIASEAAEAPEKRLSQYTLADEITTFIHGKGALERAQKISKALFYGNIQELSEDELSEGFADVPSTTIKECSDLPLIDLLVTSGISGSKRQAREDIQNNAISINGTKTTSLDKKLVESDRLFGKFTVLRKGKKTYHLVRW